MAWACYSCGTKNSNSLDACQKCGGNVAAPRNFYLHWVFGGAAFFLITYLLGVFVGGVLVEISVAPEENAVYDTAKKMGLGVGANSAMELKPDEAKAAKEKLIAKGKERMPPVKRHLLQWFLPAILFIGCGILVGFVSDGKTIIEAGFGSVVGQVLGFVLLVYGFSSDLNWLAVVIGVVPGFGLAMVGAWLGEIWQDRRERAGG